MLTFGIVNDVPSVGIELIQVEFSTTHFYDEMNLFSKLPFSNPIWGPQFVKCKVSLSSPVGSYVKWAKVHLTRIRVSSTRWRERDERLPLNRRQN